MPFSISSLLSCTDARSSAIKLELFIQVATIIQDIHGPFGDKPLADPIAYNLVTLAMSSGDPNVEFGRYIDLCAFLDSEYFHNMAAGGKPEGSRIHFRQLLRVLEATLEQNPALTENQAAQITNLLKRTDIHRNNY